MLQMIKHLYDKLFNAMILAERSKNFSEAFKDELSKNEPKIDISVEDYFQLLTIKYYYEAYRDFVNLVLDSTSLDLSAVASVFTAIKSYDAVIDEDTKQVIIPINLISDDEELYNKVKQNIDKNKNKKET